MLGVVRRLMGGDCHPLGYMRSCCVDRHMCLFLLLQHFSLAVSLYREASTCPTLRQTWAPCLCTVVLLSYVPCVVLCALDIMVCMHVPLPVLTLFGPMPYPLSVVSSACFPFTAFVVVSAARW